MSSNRSAFGNAASSGTASEITHRQDRELPSAVQARDDTRREATEASVGVVQEHRPVGHLAAERYSAATSA